MDNGISVTAWGSLAGSLFQNAKALTVDGLKAIAAEHSVTVAQVLLRWALQKGFIVIPGTSNPKHMEQNLATYGFQLTQENMVSIDAMSKDPTAQEFFYVPEDDS